MAGGYDNEDRQAELEELRQEKEREAREKLEAQHRQAALRRDNLPEPGELPRPRDSHDDGTTSDAAVDQKGSEARH